MLSDINTNNALKKSTNFFLVLSFAAYASTKLNTKRLNTSQFSAPVKRERWFPDLWRLLKLCFPHFISIESIGVFIELYLIFKRASLIITRGRIVGRATRHLMQNNQSLFLRDIVDLSLLSIPGTLTHVGVWWIRSIIKEKLKENLHRNLAKKYFSNDNVYHCAAKGLRFPERYLGENINSFCNSFINLVETLIKPVVTILTLSIELTKIGDFYAPLAIISYYLAIYSVKKLILPNFTDLLMTANVHEAQIRSLHNRLVQHAEEIAFYNGEARERQRVKEVLENLKENEKNIKKGKWKVNLFDSFFIQHGSLLLCFVLCGILIKQKSLLNADKADLTEFYLKMVNICTPLRKAIGVLLCANLKISGLERTVKEASVFQNALRDDKKNLIEKEDSRNEEPPNRQQVLECIKLSHVDITTPTNQCLIKDFSITIQKDSHVLILGKNGCGKTAIVRILLGIWPRSSGEISRPPLEHIFFSHRRVYFPPGSLRAQLVYPIKETEIDDKELLRYVNLVGLQPVLQRVKNLSAKANWGAILSGGEQQRIGIVRILVNHPLFAILDESTSAVSVDDEKSLYLALQSEGITLITISQRTYLTEIHDFTVDIKEGNYQISKNERHHFSPLRMN